MQKNSRSEKRKHLKKGKNKKKGKKKHAQKKTEKKQRGKQNRLAYFLYGANSSKEGFGVLYCGKIY